METNRTAKEIITDTIKNISERNQRTITITELAFGGVVSVSIESKTTNCSISSVQEYSQGINEDFFKQDAIDRAYSILLDILVDNAITEI